MFRRDTQQRMRWLPLTFLLVAVLWPQQMAQAAPRCFAETGFCLNGPFRAFWEQRGGLAVFGFPITGEVWEDGRRVQYFERNRFEWHPENPQAHQVLLGQLGVERMRASGRDWRTLAFGEASAECAFFAETSHTLCGPFRTWWEKNGGLAVFGFPISEPAVELNEADGQRYTVQYFERNRFELHPDNPAPYRVQLGLLGSWRAAALLGTARQPHSVQATVSGPNQVVQPFDPVTLRVAATGYSGPATLRLVDGAGVLEDEIPLTLVDGAATTDVAATGALGPHAATVIIGEAVAGIASTVYTLDATTNIATGVAAYDTLVPRVRALLAQDSYQLNLGGRAIYGYRSPDSPLLWLRDHVYQGVGFRYFERNMTSLLDYFRSAQQPDGAFDDYVGQQPDGTPIQGRMQVEADLEFLFVQGMVQAWQTTGDDAWLQKSLASAERGLRHSTSSALRWDAAHGLVKRPYTIDMWDFELGPQTTSPDGKLSLRHWIDDATRFGIMHGDNTGTAQAMLLTANAYGQLGDTGQATEWRGRAFALIAHLNAVSWNGSFFRHFTPLAPLDVPGVDSEQQLSLSNAYALNRGVLNAAQAQSILAEYQRRRSTAGAFAEWFSLDPPFPAGSFGTAEGVGPGEYVNGGIMPLVGGELARGAFRWGQPDYGFDILRRYQMLLDTQNGRSYLWYKPDGTPGISNGTTLASDGWGAAAMLAALIEGAAGVRDISTLLRQIELTPAWAADDAVQQATVVVRYPASLGYAAYRWERLPNSLRLRVTGAQGGVVRLLLPAGAGDVQSVSVAGVAAPYQIEQSGARRYVTLPLRAAGQTIEIRWTE